MMCRRCEGLMVQVQLHEVAVSAASSHGWQCLICGHVTDAAIEANRQSPVQPRPNHARPHGTT
jgi:hypothetical protein